MHGGPRSDPALVDDGVVDEIRDLVPLAPLHNPGALAGIEAARAAFDVPQVAVFDTAFFTTLPAAASTYAIPEEVREQHRVRRYGFHGTSHRYVSRAVAGLLDRPLDSFDQVVLHLGNGCSASAIAGGEAVDTSMGLTPLEGLVMGTRSGDIDPAVFTFLHTQVGMAVADIDTMLNKRSGLKGLAGANDFREVLDARRRGRPDAVLAIDVYVHRLRHYVGRVRRGAGWVRRADVHGRGRRERSCPARRRGREPRTPRHRRGPGPQRGVVAGGPGDLARRLPGHGHGRAHERGARDRPPDRRPARRARPTLTDQHRDGGPVR